MKRYWLFEAEQYYPNGGMSDWVGDYDTIEEAQEARTSKFDPDIKSPGDVNAMWVKAQQEGIDPNKWYEMRKYYQKISSDYSKELQKQGVGYHILDIQLGLIVEGWNQFADRVIPMMSIKQFKLL